MDTLHATTTLHIHEQVYQLEVAATSNELQIMLSDEKQACEWQTRLTVAQVEEMTMKTGSYKAYRIFLKMIHTSMVAPSEVVHLDVLTHADLENLRARKAGMGAGANVSNLTEKQSNSAKQNIKRYLILTYSNEFERLHYPLPLKAVEPTVEYLKIVVEKLRKEIEMLRAGNNTASAQAEDASRKLKLQHQKHAAFMEVDNYGSSAASEDTVRKLQAALDAERHESLRLREQLQESLTLQAETANIVDAEREWKRRALVAEREIERTMRSRSSGAYLSNTQRSRTPSPAINGRRIVSSRLSSATSSRNSSPASTTRRSTSRVSTPRSALASPKVSKSPSLNHVSRRTVELNSTNSSRRHSSSYHRATSASAAHVSSPASRHATVTRPTLNRIQQSTNRHFHSNVKTSLNTSTDAIKKTRSISSSRSTLNSRRTNSLLNSTEIADRLVALRSFLSGEKRSV